MIIEAMSRVAEQHNSGNNNIATEYLIAIDLAGVSVRQAKMHQLRTLHLA